MSSFEVEGLKELEKQLLKMEAKVAEKMLRQAGRQAMKPVLNAAISKVSVDTGNLKASLAIRASKGKGKKTAAVISVGAFKKKLSKKQGGGKIERANAKALSLEYGNSRQKAAPFLRPALEERVNDVLATFKSELKKRIEKAAK